MRQTPLRRPCRQQASASGALSHHPQARTHLDRHVVIQRQVVHRHSPCGKTLFELLADGLTRQPPEMRDGRNRPRLVIDDEPVTSCSITCRVARSILAGREVRARGVAGGPVASRWRRCLSLNATTWSRSSFMRFAVPCVSNRYPSTTAYCGWLHARLNRVARRVRPADTVHNSIGVPLG